MKKDYTKFVDVFFGCDPTSLPKRKGIASSWRPIKGMCGNTSPEAVLPFSKMSCCAYSGAYPTGYGICSVNSCHKIKPLFPYLPFKGFSHIHPSGTGFINYFYNYCLVAPYQGDIRNAFGMEQIINEKGTPGFYQCTTASGTYSCTITKDCAFHKFDFGKKPGKVAVDFSQYGLIKKSSKLYTDYSYIKTTVIDEHTVTSETSFYGVPVYFAFYAKNNTSVSLFTKDGITNSKNIDFSSYQGISGATFDFDGNAETVLAISFLSNKDALVRLNEEKSRTFDEVKSSAHDIWNEALTKIEVEGTDDELYFFYSNLYFSLIKPMDVSGEKLYGFDGNTVTDLATLWDMYKVTLPLLFSVYPDIGKKVVDTILSFRKQVGVMPNSILISSDLKTESNQARLLSALILTDACLRNIESAEKIYPVLKEEFLSDNYKSFHMYGKFERTTHTMDMYEASKALCLLARGIDDDFAEELGNKYPLIKQVYNKKTGLLLARSTYYEGNFINYSFRLHAEPSIRIESAGGKEKLTKLLDYFFGYRLPWLRFGKFEGFNNETDMETPYCYHFVGRQDRLSEIIDLSRKYMWAKGRGGIPGNNDSGALSSLYIWNALGIFPVSGQDKHFIGTPLFTKSVLHLTKGDFVIERQGKGIYCKKVFLNGKEIPSYELSVADVINGGHLLLIMSEKA